MSYPYVPLFPLGPDETPYRPLDVSGIALTAIPIV